MKKAAVMTMVVAALCMGALIGCEDKKPATPTPPAGGAKAPTTPPPAPAPTPAPAGGTK
jgi:hypothetical protein